MKFMVSLRKELLELWRTHRFLVTSVVLVLFGMISPLLAKLAPQLLKMVPGGERFVAMMPPPTIADAIAQYVKNINQFGILLALLTSMGTVSREKEKGTAAIILVKPLPRSIFLLSKFTALSLSFLVSLALAAVVAYYYTMILFEAPRFPSWVALNVLIWLSLLVYIGLTMLFSTIFKSQWAAAGLGLVIIFFFSAGGSIPAIGKYLPLHLISWGSALLKGSAASSWPALWVSLSLILLSLLAAWVIFQRQEL